MGTPRGRDDAGFAYLRAFVEEMKASGFVADRIAAHGVVGLSVAPAASPPRRRCVAAGEPSSRAGPAAPISDRPQVSAPSAGAAAPLSGHGSGGTYRCVSSIGVARPATVRNSASSVHHVDGGTSAAGE